MIIYYVQTLLKNSRYALVIFACLFVQSAFSQDYYRIVNSDFLNLRNACMTQKSNVVYKIQKQDTLLAIGGAIKTTDKKIWLQLQTKSGIKGFAIQQSGNTIYLEKIKKVIVEPKKDMVQKPNKDKKTVTPIPVEEPSGCNNFVSITLPHTAGSTLKVCLDDRNLTNDPIIDYMMKDILFVRDLTENIPYTLIQCDKMGNNCVAVSHKNKPYIVLSDKFLKKVLDDYGEMAVYFILAHEIAHHNKCHITDDAVSLKEEQDADFSAGSMLKRLGATKDDLQIIYKFLSHYNPTSSTHGTASSRKKSVEKGWQQTPDWAKESKIRKIIKDKDYNDVGRFRSDFIWIKKNNRFGFVNHLGREIIAPIYTEVENFSDAKGVYLTRVKNAQGVWKTVNKYGITIK